MNTNAIQATCETAFIDERRVSNVAYRPQFVTNDHKNGKKIMTTDYLTFSEPKALMKLASLSNIELKMYCVEEEKTGFHTKRYMFKQEEIYGIIIGSANMTLNALTKNKEWNTKVVSTEQGEFAKETLKEFYELWDHAKPLTSWIDTYTEIYNEQKRITKATKLPMITQARLMHLHLHYVL